MGKKKGSKPMLRTWAALCYSLNGRSRSVEDQLLLLFYYGILYLWSIKSYSVDSGESAAHPIPSRDDSMMDIMIDCIKKKYAAYLMERILEFIEGPLYFLRLAIVITRMQPMMGTKYATVINYLHSGDGRTLFL